MKLFKAISSTFVCFVYFSFLELLRDSEWEAKDIVIYAAKSIVNYAI